VNSVASEDCEDFEGSEGFALVEALIAIAIFIAIAVGIAQLIAVSMSAIRAAREQTTAAVLAAAKIDQLRSLAWTYEPSAADVAAVPRSDRTTDVSHPGLASGGAGLQPSSPTALVTNTTNYVDYLDAAGQWVGHDIDPPPDAVFVRRWAVRPLPDDPERTLVLQVLVTTVRDDRSRSTPWNRPTGADALLVSVRTRAGQ
jgi:type II secretory pathway pseudopilin PulG